MVTHPPASRCHQSRWDRSLRSLCVRICHSRVASVRIIINPLVLGGVFGFRVAVKPPTLVRRRGAASLREVAANEKGHEAEGHQRETGRKQVTAAPIEPVLESTQAIAGGVAIPAGVHRGKQRQAECEDAHTPKDRLPRHAP